MAKKVYIGVGHGGSDPGAVSGKHKEKAYALDIANACTAELTRHGLAVMQSRKSDVTESAAAKVDECNRYSPDLALDIHLNAGGGDGFEVYRSITGGKGVALAQKIEAAVKAIGQNSRGVKTKKNSSGRDYYGIIRQTKCPAVLVEVAFIDSKDVQIVDTLAERQKMGKAIAHGVLAYLGVSVKASAPSGSTATVQRVTVSLPQLQKGSTGAPVKTLQRLLIANGVDCGESGADGDFGAMTEEALTAYQKAKKLTANGTADAKTWAALLGV